MWKNININKQNIEVETNNAILIKMPNNSDYKGYVFWHTLKLVRSGRHSNAISIGYNDEFTFKLIKYGKGKYNKKEIIDEIEIDVEEFEEAFEVMNDNIQTPSYKSDYETHKPNELKVTKQETLEELKDE